MKTLSIRFLLKPTKKGSSDMTLNVRLIYDRSKSEFSTGIRCMKNEWDTELQHFPEDTHRNQGMRNVKDKIYRAKNELDDLETPYRAIDIRDRIFGKKTIALSLIHYYEEFLGRKENDDTSYNTFLKYKQTLKYLKQFARTKRGKSHLLARINLPWIVELDDFLRSVSWNDLGDKMGTSTRNKHHVRVKAVLNDAIKRGHIPNNPYQQYKLSFPQANREYLTKVELEKIMDVDLSNNKTLAKVRDIFLFSCYTGLRFQDAMDITMDNLIDVDGEAYLQLDQRKTGERREIPLLMQAQRLIDKYEGSKERQVKNLVLPKLSNQKTNEYLKVIANLAGITKPLSHHIARHTCATTVLLDNGVSIDVVSHWLGHRSIRTTQIYGKTSHRNLSKVKGDLDDILSADLND
jgi:integrase/recombinase XerD